MGKTLDERCRFKASEIFESHEAVPEMFRNLNSMQRLAVFHAAMRFERPKELVVSPLQHERKLRAKLLIEEVFETIEKGLGLRIKINMAGGKSIRLDAEDFVYQIDGVYDPVETADGLSDVKVIANGTADIFGIPQAAVDYEVFCSNMTKLDENGAPIINRCTEATCTEVMETHTRGDNCRNPEHWIDPTKPNGKILKPQHYTPANVLRVLLEHTTPHTTSQLLDHMNLIHDKEESQ